MMWGVLKHIVRLLGNRPYRAKSGKITILLNFRANKLPFMTSKFVHDVMQMTHDDRN